MPEIVSRGCGILFFHPGRDAVLIFRRDDIPQIPFPGMLDILGGHVESGESPEEAIIREMAEELVDRQTGRPFILSGFQPFVTYVDSRGCEQSIFWLEVDFEKDDLELLEGEELVWLTEQDLTEGLQLAFEFEWVIQKFFESRSVFCGK